MPFPENVPISKEEANSVIEEAGDEVTRLYDQQIECHKNIRNQEIFYCC